MEREELHNWMVFINVLLRNDGRKERSQDWEVWCQKKVCKWSMWWWWRWKCDVIGDVKVGMESGKLARKVVKQVGRRWRKRKGAVDGGRWREKELKSGGQRGEWEWRRSEESLVNTTTRIILMSSMLICYAINLFIKYNYLKSASCFHNGKRLFSFFVIFFLSFSYFNF